MKQFYKVRVLAYKAGSEVEFSIEVKDRWWSRWRWERTVKGLDTARGHEIALEIADKLAGSIIVWQS